MKWERLLLPYRLGCPKTKSNDYTRHEFQRDFDRIIFSPAFRRLQGKTQVFPFPQTDMIHTRLTHSLETASVGRSLGTMVGIKLRSEGINEWELGSLLSVACLAHDLGNPPLGHSGEDAIREYFNTEKGQSFLDGLEPNAKSDFTDFESNALGFHFMTHSNSSNTEAKGGLALTLPVLSTYCKYPTPSFYPNRKSNSASEDKSGLFYCDIPVYEKQVAEVLGIEKKGDFGWFRHPLAFLNEAADDICYTIIDFEDGYKHGIIPYDIIAGFFEDISLVQKRDDLKNMSKIKNKHDIIGYLRSKAINSLVHQVADAFLENEKKILNCDFDLALCKNIESHSKMLEIIDISRKDIYNYHSVVQIETAGFKVIPGLLDIFLTALREKSILEKSNMKCRRSTLKILKLIPESYLIDFGKDQYNSILGIVGYIAGMTDRFSIDLYRNISGIELPNY